MKKESAGILLYRHRQKKLEVLLVHPGGPFWKKKDEGAWTIPKGEIDEEEDSIVTALREFEEETGMVIEGTLIELDAITQKSGKKVHAWAVEGEFEPTSLISNKIQIEWPPKSGKNISIPEVDRAEWFSIDEANTKINPAQAGFLNQLKGIIS